VSVTPIQATVLGYFSPGSSLSPYLLIGGGWYPTHADGPYSPSRLFGPHVGAGLELLLGSNWSLDGSYRFLWTETISWSNPVHLFGQDFSVRGHMFTVALNYRL
jgi:opacity protein-like surface antigen